MALLLPTGCIGGGGSTPSNQPGTGKAELHLETVEWGRLVDVFDADGVLVEEDVLIRESLQGDGVQYSLGLNALTQAEILTILKPQADAGFDSLFRAAQSGRTAVVTKGSNSPPTFTRVGRNGAIRLQFSELVDPETVNRLTIQVMVGAENQEVRYVVKNGETGLDGKPKGVVILDPTISALDQAKYGIPENGVGFPPSDDQINTNIQIRIPTALDPLFGQTMVLLNRGRNHSLTPTASDPVDLSPNFDPIVVRAFRTGNGNDPSNGFMVDLQRPKLITDLEVDVASVAPVSGSPTLRQLTYSINVSQCQGVTPKAGDIFELNGAVLLTAVVDDDSNPSAYVVTAAILDGSPSAGTGTLTSAYESNDSDYQLCWLKFSPEPETLPAQGVDPYATITLHFNEAIDAATVKSMETMVLVSFTKDFDNATGEFEPGNESVGDYIDRQLGYETIFNADAGEDPTGSGRIKFGPVEVTSDSRSFTLSPLKGITDAHDEGGALGSGLNLALALRDGSSGILDLAGNQVSAPLFVARDLEIVGTPVFTLAGDPSTWPNDRYFALRANATDENVDGLSEYAGQFTFEPGVLKGRLLSRFSRMADPSNPYVGQRIAFSQGIMTPLTPAGAVLHTVYGYHHLGLGLLSVSEFNLDIEGLNWSPFGGTVFDDTFDRYSIALAHSKYFPDDYIDPISGYPEHQNSGLLRQQDFDKNILGWRANGTGEDELIVFDTSYTISASNVFTAVSGSPMMPWPEFTDTYTWRDTTITKLGAPNGRGVPPEVTGAPAVWTANNVPSIGLPLLMRYRCYPEGNFFGNNGFQIQIMVGSSALPAFRVFSAGGRDSGDSWHLVVPDVPTAGTKPVGGYNTLTGTVTKQYGPELYWGQVDFVVRVSRTFTHFFEFGGELSTISAVTLEPAPEQLPAGTEVLVEFRGSSSTTVPNVNGCPDSQNPLNDAITCFDYYGEEANTNDCCGAMGLPTDWTFDPNDLLLEPDPPQFFQLRFSFVSNIQQDYESQMDAFGLAWNVLP
ncbi:MAG: hypothetical protein DWQ01_14045 [Planctomycetota bacterium]|nr:MAG: hypothetical protein DWQ01_14045 [Planctomycetota bacterium]